MEIKIAAQYLGYGRCEFILWTPFLKNVQLKIVSPEKCIVQMEKDSKGYRKKIVEGITPRTLYFYFLNEQFERPDPASNYQPQGVHGPSQIVRTKNYKKAISLYLAEVLGVSLWL